MHLHDMMPLLQEATSAPAPRGLQAMLIVALQMILLVPTYFSVTEGWSFASPLARAGILAAPPAVVVQQVAAWLFAGDAHQARYLYASYAVVPVALLTHLVSARRGRRTAPGAVRGLPTPAESP